MTDIPIKLKASNQSGDQTLHLTSDNGEVWFTLVGKYDGCKFQIDFDIMERSDLEDIKAALDLTLEALI